MPIPKGREDVEECRTLATSGDERASAGDDTAGHLSRAKRGAFENAANGAFWTSHSIAAYAQVFERANGMLDERFERFLALNGIEWRGLEPPTEDDTITIRRETRQDIPDPVSVPEEDDVVVPWGWSSEDDRLHIGFVVEA